MEIEKLYSLYLEHPSVQTDTRKLKQGDIFFALKGPNFNGNVFALKALDAGASYSVVDEKPETNNPRIILVEDALKTLQQLAAFHRDHFRIPIIAITGSNGKTTTKELVHAVLSSQFKTYTTQGNLNNHIGIPLTILKIRQDAEIAVVEMGASHLREIASYCAYAKPNFGLITNIGKAHLEGFGGAENVKKGKGELFDYLKANEGTAFINADDPNVKSIGEKLPHKIFYGSRCTPPTGELKTSDPYLIVEINEPLHEIETHLVGSYNLANVLAAVTIGRYFKVPDEKINHAIENYIPSNSRSQMLKKNGCHIILDSYNANPGSMKAAIENFAAMKSDRKILVLGDMKELGVDSLKEHQSIVDLIQKYKWSEVILAGPEFAKVNHPFHQFNNSEEVKKWVKEHPWKDAHVLIKGSHSMAMEKVAE